MDIKAVLILSFLHFATDLNQGALPALLPFFKQKFDLTYTVTGTLVFFSNLFSSVVQPLFGYIADRTSLRWLLPLAPLIASAGMALSGLAPSFLLLIPLVVISGIGVALFHPEAFKGAYSHAGQKKATGVSLFAFGGSMGIAVGPLYALTAVSHVGLKGTLALLLPAAFGSLSFLLAEKRRSKAPRQAPPPTRHEPLTRTQKVAFVLLVLLAMFRAWTQFGIASYIPFYWIEHLRGSPVVAGKLVSTFLVSGAVGTLLGGPVADRVGHKRFLLVTLLASVPLLQGLFYLRGPALFVLLSVAGAILISSFGTTTVMGQVLLPQYVGMASGIMVGLTISTGGLGLTLLGAIADRWGVPVALRVTTLLPLCAFLIGLFVRYPKKAEAKGT